MRTYTGQMVNPLAPDVNLHDIAWALAGQVRFAGQSTQRLTVAQHSVNVANRAAAIWDTRNNPNAARLTNEQRYARETVRLYGLLHDAHEAYFMDVPSPVKGAIEAICPGYRLIEEDLQRRVLGHFGLECPLPEEVEWADQQAVQSEITWVWKPGQREVLGHDEAFTHFLETYWDIWATRKENAPKETA
jgi:hypothetical protein